MLERLYVKNVALIEVADVQFNPNFNVLSGETGSGKSVILDSINFVLGSKADKSMIRYGTNEAVVRAEFSLDAGSEACKVLDELDIEADGTVIISRRLTQDGRGGIKINGNTVTAAMLKKVSSHLVDVHGQSEHFFLLSEGNQLSVIDTLCGKNSAELKGQLCDLLGEKRELKRKIELLGGSEQERAQKLDILKFQIDEIEGANISVGEMEKLQARKKLIDNAERVLCAVNAVKEILSSDNGCIDLLSAASKKISAVSDVDKQYEEIYDRLENLSIEANDLSETVSDIAENFSFDQNEAAAVEERLNLIKRLLKKYGASEELVLEFLENAKSQYDGLNDAAAELERISKKIAEIDRKCFEICLKITQMRKQKCVEFCAEVVKQLQSLNIPNAQFYVDFTSYTQENCNITTNGADEICFMFSANKGEPPKPLNKVISGGEMSRFMLAVKTQLKGLNGISTYIFDEIDAGISGITAKTVADKFVAISKDTQIIAVSHLPQVCAAANAHYYISKCEIGGEKTVTNVRLLDRKERINELVRLTGSIVTDAAMVHAEELLTQFNN